jgi:transposase-like protein
VSSADRVVSPRSAEEIRRSEDEKQRLLDAWTKSGLSAHAFERREGLNKSCLWRWKRTVSEQAASREVKPRPAITFAPVHVAKPATPITVRSERVQAEVLLGRELRVRVFEGADVVQVGRFIQALAGGAAC